MQDRGRSEECPMNDEKILVALKALAHSELELEAPPAVETRALRAFRQRQTTWRRWRWGVAWTVTAAVAAGLTLLFWNRPAPPPRQPVQTAAIVPTLSPVEPAPMVSRPRPKAIRVKRVPPREFVTEFYPLVDVAPPFERGTVVRVRLSAAALRTVGIPVDEDHLADRIQADVLVSEEGLARAIRLVKVVQ
jgi:hypothetical protein